MTALALAALLMAGDRDWTTTDTVLQATFVGITATDYLQTRTFLKYDPDAEEANPVLGRRPSQEKLAIYVGAAVVGHTAIAYALPKPWRTLWQLAWIGIEGAVVHGNHQMGVRIRW